MKPKLSIILPAIRVDRWDQLYNSIQYDSFELIIVSPYQLTPFLQSQRNVKFVKDYGSPMRASCIGANVAEGKYITHVADDGICFPDTIKKAVSILDNDINGRLVAVTKYLEACEQVHPDWYYQLNIAYPKTPYIPDSWLIFNCCFMHREYYEYLGGWDTQFESNPLGHADLAARAQRNQCSITLIQDPLLNCTHMPGASGDHGPIYYAHTEHDESLYRQIYSSADCINRVRIDINNWKNADTVWRRRFG